MKVLIDGHMLGRFEGGNERYVKNLAHGLSQIDGVDLKILVDKNFKGKRKIFVKCAPRSNFQRVFFSIPEIADRYGFDIVHSTYIGPINLARRVKLVLTVHDVAFKRFPEFFCLREKLIFNYLFPLSIKRADAIIVPSIFIKREFSHYYPKEKAKVYVTHEAAEPIFKPGNGKSFRYLGKRFGIKTPFLLTFNSRFKKRNIAGVVKAFKQVSGKFPDLSLIVVGGKYNIPGRNIKNLKILEKVQDNDLARLYSAARAVIYTPFYEGFGLPVLEALSSNTNLVVSDIPVFKEIIKNGAIFANPNKPLDIANAVLRILEDKLFARKLNEEGRKEAKNFSWRKTAIQTLDIYKKVLKK